MISDNTPPVGDKPKRGRPRKPVSDEPPVKRKRGRPRKSEITPAKRPVGRPKGDISAMAEMKQRFLARRDTDAVINSIFKAAMDDDHKNQAAAWKLVVDRILPVSAFDKDKLGGKPTVNITISGVTDGAISTESPLDGEYEEVNDV